MSFLDTTLDEVREFLGEKGLHDRFVSFEGPWRDFDVYYTCPHNSSSASDQEIYVLECPMPSKRRFRLYHGRIPSLPINSDDISIEDLTTNQMLCNRHFVDYLDKIGKSKFEDWNLDAYLCGKMGPGDYHPDVDLALIDYSEIEGLVLNGPDGVHYGYELFLKPRKQWPLRGAPFFWCEMARELTDIILPLSEEAIDDAVRKLKEKHGIPDNGEEWVWVPDYCAGIHSGMSSGAVFPDGINQMADEIKKRNAQYAESPKSFVEKYVMRFEEFPFLF